MKKSAYILLFILPLLVHCENSKAEVFGQSKDVLISKDKQLQPVNNKLLNNEYNKLKITKDSKINDISLQHKYHEFKDGVEDFFESGDDDNPLHSFLMSSVMILFSEIGDKTFLVAALMAMRAPRLTVFTAAHSALALMTVLSAFLGHTLPSILSPKYTHYLASILFLVFGIKLLKEGFDMSPQAGVEEEMKEVEDEIDSKEMSKNLDQLEKGGNIKKPAEHHHKRSKSTSEAVQYVGKQFLFSVENLASFILSPVWVQVFIMTFLGEWGDRSQIATIALAAGSDYWFVILGAIIGHGFCTFGAVIGGKLLASRISMRTVTISGALAFLVFSIVYFYEALAIKA